MLNFNFKKTAKINSRFLQKKKNDLSFYLSELKKIINEKKYNSPEGFLLLPEEFSLRKIRKELPFSSYFFDLILLVGVGGSSLGPQAIYEALKRKKIIKEMIVLDALNPLLFRKAVQKVKENKTGKTAVFFISKSGKTFETTANFFALYPLIKKQKPSIFVISDKNSFLWRWGLKNNFFTFDIPEKVGGRYSLFSNVGVLPLILSGIDVKKLILGAKKANSFCLSNSLLENHALSSALTIFYHYKERKNIYSNIVFPPDLEYFGRWYVQLMAESLGKEGKGITPTVTTGTTDFHAIGQLYFDGPLDKLINFVFVKNLDIDYTIKNINEFEDIFPGMSGKTIWHFNKAIFEGVKRAYLKKNLPFTETILSKLDEENLGMLFQAKMIEIILLAKLMQVNAFDQPGVELYKQETRKIVQKSEEKIV